MTYNLDENEDLLRRYNLPLLEKRVIQELHGAASIIIYDGVVDDNEIGFLTEWLTSNSEFLNVWPLSELSDLLTHILKDGVVDAQERLALLRFLSGIACSPGTAGTAGDSLFDTTPEIILGGRSFLFTGKLEMGTRKRAETAVIECGGTIAKSPRRDLDFLIVGSLGTDQWKYSRYGGKIEKIVQNRERGARTVITREVDFVAAVIDAGAVP